MTELGFDAAHTLPTAALNAFLTDERTSEESRLAHAASRGDRSAFTDLMRRCQGQVYGLCYRLMGDRDSAKDAAQEAFARAYANLASFDPEQRFDVWVLRIARNHCFDQLRRKGNRNEPEEAAMHAADPNPLPHEQLERAEVSRGLEAALEKLPASDREVLALYYVQHKTTKEIAGILGVAPGTIMARLFRAREKLRRSMTEANHELP